MKNLLAVLLIACLLVVQNLSSQVSFSIAPYTCQNSTLDLAVQFPAAFTNFTWSAQPNTVVFTSANSYSTAIVFGSIGNYSITVTTNLGSSTKTIAVVAAMNFTATQSSATTCITNNFPKYSKPVTITTSGANTCTWNPILLQPISPPPINSQTQVAIRPVSSACYTITGFFGFCNATTAVCVSVTPQFTVDIIGNFEYCEPYPAKVYISSIGANAVAPYTYSWTEMSAVVGSIDDGVLPQVNLTPWQSASYTVEVRDADNCLSEPKIITINKSSCVGIAEAKKTTAVQVQYQALQKTLKINTEAETTITVYGTDGKVLLQKSVQNTFIQSTSDWSRGLYYVSLRSDKGTHIEKIIID